jgi:alcohol dehydrogenase (cytochrome c)
MKSFLRWLLFLLAFLVLGCVVLAVAAPKVRMGLLIVWSKGTGSLSDVEWGDLYKMVRSGKHFSLPELSQDPNPYSTIRNPYTSAADLSDGKANFRSHCETCHGADGDGGPGGPVLKHRKMAHGSSDWALFRTISLGVHGTAMPASNLPWVDRWRLVAYVKSLMVQSEMPLDSAELEKISLKPVIPEDIKSSASASGQWLTYSGSYDGHRFSSLDQISSANVHGLRLIWSRQYSITDASIENSPLVIGNYMFVTIPPNRVEALDATNGLVKWTYERQLPEKLSLCCGSANRGLAVLGKTLFVGTLDAHLIALDLETGVVRWDVVVADYKSGYSITSAPLALKNMVVTGVAGGEFGIRGFVTARDASTGKEIWKFYSIPEPGQPGGNTWSGASWKTGGGPTWLTGSYDSESNTIYWPVGNPGPNFSGDERQGDNLYSNSVLALDADQGALKWHFQFTPHDVYDWDSTEILLLFDREIAGKHKSLLAQADRNGFYYLLDRENGHFISAHPFARQTWAKSIDANGRPLFNPEAVPTENGTVVYPGVGGATSWQSPSYSPSTGLVYVPALEWGAIFFKGHSNFSAGEMFLGGSFQYFPGVRPVGAIRAIDAITGELKWEHTSPAYHIGGLLSTGGNVVFGSHQDSFLALDAKNGKELWRVDTNGRIVAAPMTFLSNGKQYVTIAAGHDILTFGL